MADSTNPFLTVAQQWPKLEPAWNPEDARTKHVKLANSVSYPLGQIVGVETATGRYKAPGVGVTAPYFPLQYPMTTDAAGNASLGSTVRANDSKFETVPVYWRGVFYARDLTGIADDAFLALVGKRVQGVNLADTMCAVEL